MQHMEPIKVPSHASLQNAVSTLIDTLGGCAVGDFTTIYSKLVTHLKVVPQDTPKRKHEDFRVSSAAGGIAQ